MTQSEETQDGFIRNRALSSLAYLIALSFVVMGLMNVTPSIPGWDTLWRDLTGWSDFKIRRFPNVQERKRA